MPAPDDTIYQAGRALYLRARFSELYKECSQDNNGLQAQAYSLF